MSPRRGPLTSHRQNSIRCVTPFLQSFLQVFSKILPADSHKKARQFSVHNEEESETEPRRHVSVLVHISNVRTEPKILFLVDPWDLFRAGQLVLETATKYRASLRLQTNEATTTGQEANDAGFDTVQFKSRGVAQAGPAYGKPPAYPDEKGKGVLREG